MSWERGRATIEHLLDDGELGVLGRVASTTKAVEPAEDLDAASVVATRL